MINIYNKDCLEAMKEMSDNQFDLAIVDPPYGINVKTKESQINHKYSLIVVAVAHSAFVSFDYQSMRNSESLIYDLKGILPRNISDERL